LFYYFITEKLQSDFGFNFTDFKEILFFKSLKSTKV